MVLVGEDVTERCNGGHPPAWQPVRKTGRTPGVCEPNVRRRHHGFSNDPAIVIHAGLGSPTVVIDGDRSVVVVGDKNLPRSCGRDRLVLRISEDLHHQVAPPSRYPRVEQNIPHQCQMTGVDLPRPLVGSRPPGWSTSHALILVPDSPCGGERGCCWVSHNWRCFPRIVRPILQSPRIAAGGRDLCSREQTSQPPGEKPRPGKGVGRPRNGDALRPPGLGRVPRENARFLSVPRR